MDHWDNFTIAILIILFIWLCYVYRKNNHETLSDESSSNDQKSSQQNIPPPPYVPELGSAEWNKLSRGEQLQYITDIYIKMMKAYDSQSNTPEAIQKAADDKFVAQLPQDSNCTDEYSSCQEWADNGECEINPEFMLYNCKKSCKVCSLTGDEKSELVRIYNSREPAHCVYHGANYPGPSSYMNTLNEYNALAFI